jgi:retron-type reverse transcriptase
MRREGYLMGRIADPDNLRFAFWKACRGKNHYPEVEAYRLRLDDNLTSLREQLLAGNVSTGDYSYFTIYEPKKRLICAAAFSERVMHHALMNVCHPVFERFQISDSYATRPGKGQYAALEHAKILVRRHQWFGKFDARKYFDSINHETLYGKISRLFKDPLLLKVFRGIIDSYETTPGHGLPIGNLTSQYFANYYLAYADHFAKEKLQAKAYLRYMDDMLFFHDDKTALIEIMKRFNAYVDENLHLCLKPVCINDVSKGVPFLGYTLFPRHVRLGKISKKRFVRKYAVYAGNLACGKWTEQDYATHLCPLIAFTRFAHARHFRQTVSQSMEASQRV